jgi:hypothetical protein
MPISQASINKLTRPIATISQWPELEARYFLEESRTKDAKTQKEKALALVLTLKHYANPMSGYPIDTAANTALDNVIKSLNDPTRLQPGLQFDADEKSYLIDAFRIKLDKLADEITIEYKLQSDIQATILKLTLDATPSAEQVSIEERWWNSRTDQQKEEIIKRSINLNENQRKHLTERMNYSYSRRNTYYDCHRNVYYVPCSYYQMCFIEAELNYLVLRTVIDLSALTMYGALRGVSVVPYYAFNRGFGPHHTYDGFSFRGGSKSDGEVFLAIAAVVAFIALATSAVVGALYSTKKAFNSIRNIFTGEKIFRSLYRLAGTAGSAYLGIFAGAIVGAALGSVIPGIGTAVGTILGALLTKQTARLFSYLTHKDELNPTNPDKWRLSEKRLTQMEQKGIDISRVNEAIYNIRQEKKKLKDLDVSFFWTDKAKQKNLLNAQLKAIKKIDLQYPPDYHFFKPMIPSAPPIELDIFSPQTSTYMRTLR